MFNKFENLKIESPEYKEEIKSPIGKEDNSFKDYDSLVGEEVFETLANLPGKFFHKSDYLLLQILENQKKIMNKLDIK